MAILQSKADEAVARYGRDSVEGAAAANELGVVSKFAGLFDDAEAAYARALPVAERSAANGDPELLANLLHNLGGLAHSRQRYADAEAFARQGLELRRATSIDPSNVAADAAALGAILEQLEQFDEAEALYREALARWEEVGDHYEAAMTRNGLAAVLRFTGRVHDAEVMFRAALAAMEDARGADHPDTATIRNNLAMLLNASDRVDEALPLLQEAAAALARLLGEDHPATRDVVGNRDRVAARYDGSSSDSRSFSKGRGPS